MNRLLKLFLTTGIATSVALSLSGCDNKEQNAAEAKVEKTTNVIADSAIPASLDNRTTDEILSNAIALQAQAAKLNHAWRPTADFISRATQLITDGDTEKARATALRAELSATASINQAKSEQTAWQDRFPK